MRRASLVALARSRQGCLRSQALRVAAFSVPTQDFRLDLHTLPASFTATLPADLTAIAGTCAADVNPGGCTIAANGGTVTWNGQLNANATVTIIYRARIAASAGLGSTFTINNTGTVANLVTNLPYTFSVTCPAIVNTRVSDQKAGSVLVFPYYTSTIGGGSDPRMTISNISNAASSVANQAYVHLFFIDGTTCA